MSDDQALHDLLDALFDLVPVSDRAIIGITRNTDNAWYNVAVIDEGSLDGEVLVKTNGRRGRLSGGGETIRAAIESAIEQDT